MAVGFVEETLKVFCFVGCTLWSNLIRCEVLVRDNPDEQIFGAALKAVSLVRYWPRRKDDERLTMQPN